MAKRCNVAKHHLMHGGGLEVGMGGIADSQNTKGECAARERRREGERRKKNGKKF